MDQGSLDQGIEFLRLIVKTLFHQDLQIMDQFL
jgi:hypothetical protein